ncbi:DUF4870 domain-containing protein [Cellulomonas soli]|uniref:DUF4870 domain-containing protein n=1 Tax=Cellulomonas soli TaxID=931535 RepID=UPI003F84F439
MSGQYPPPAYVPPSAPPLRPDEERTWAILGHLLTLVAGFLAPLVIWLVFKGRGPYLEDQAKESLNFQLTLLIAYVVGGVTSIIGIGLVILALAAIAQLLFAILAAVAVGRFEWYRYPVTLRMVS